MTTPLPDDGLSSPQAAPRLYMDATITRNQSLGRTGRKVVLIVLCVAATLISGVLFALGAWPAPLFLGLDILAVAWAFHLAERGSRRQERVSVSADAVTVRRHDRLIWTSPTAFTGVSVEQGGEPEVRVRLTLSRRRLSVGAALSPLEREAFADALREAIRMARAERYPAV